jgi:hypothetical protein
MRLQIEQILLLISQQYPARTDQGGEAVQGVQSSRMCSRFLAEKKLVRLAPRLPKRLRRAAFDGASPSVAKGSKPE